MVGYDGPFDDLNQPLDRKAAGDFDRLVEDAVVEIADRDRRPELERDEFLPELFARE